MQRDYENHYRGQDYDIWNDVINGHLFPTYQVYGVMKKNDR